MPVQDQALFVASRVGTVVFRLFLRNAFIPLWIVNLIFCEVLLPRLYIWSCIWPQPQAGEITSKVLVLADPQLTDAYSYKQKKGLLLWLTQFYCDIYMQRNFALLASYRNADSYVFLGDLMDGGREWSDEATFKSELLRFRRIFKSTSGNHYFIPGNHDIGIGKNVVPHAVSRYERTLGKINYNFTLSGHTFIALDTLSLSSSGTEYFRRANDFLTDFIENDPGINPRILLSHVPFYRKDGSTCGPLRRKPLLRQGFGYQYQNLLEPELSAYLLDKIKPTLILSGDDHDDCEYTHHNPTFQTTEHSIATFSWLQGNPFPGYAFLSLSESGPDARPSFYIEKCALPPQIRIYTWYITLLVVTLVGSVVLAAYNARQSVINYIEIPLFKRDEDSDSNEVQSFLRAKAISRFLGPLQEMRTWSVAASAFCEVLAVTFIVYVVVLLL